VLEPGRKKKGVLAGPKPVEGRARGGGGTKPPSAQGARWPAGKVGRAEGCAPWNGERGRAPPAQGSGRREPHRLRPPPGAAGGLARKARCRAQPRCSKARAPLSGPAPGKAPGGRAHLAPAPPTWGRQGPAFPGGAARRAIKNTAGSGKKPQTFRGEDKPAPSAGDREGGPGRAGQARDQGGQAFSIERPRDGSYPAEGGGGRIRSLCSGGPWRVRPTTVSPVRADFCPGASVWGRAGGGGRSSPRGAQLPRGRPGPIQGRGGEAWPARR
jgi:hypothetical protein